MMNEQEAKFICDGVYHYSPTPQPCGHKEGVICTKTEQEAKDAAIKQVYKKLLDVYADITPSRRAMISLAIDAMWSAAMEYRQRDSEADVMVKDFKSETLHIAVESIKRLQAENQRLRTALEECRKHANTGIAARGCLDFHSLVSVKNIASEALGGE
jgi:hypothetical protein